MHATSAMILSLVFFSQTVTVVAWVEKRKLYCKGVVKVISLSDVNICDVCVDTTIFSRLRKISAAGN